MFYSSLLVFGFGLRVLRVLGSVLELQSLGRGCSSGAPQHSIEEGMGSMEHVSRWIGGLLASLVVACGTGPGDHGEADTLGFAEPANVEGQQLGTSEAETAVTAASVDILHEFDVQQTHYEILDVDGSLMLQFTAPLTTKPPRIEAAHGAGALTLLEMFRALQPAEQPARRLVESHTEEARVLGRSDVSVRETRIERTVDKSQSLVTKRISDFSFGSCGEALVYLGEVYSVPGEVIVQNNALIASANIAITSPVVNKKNKVAGACNTSSAWWKFRVDRKFGSNNWVTARSDFWLAPDHFTGFVQSATSYYNTDLRSVSVQGSTPYVWLAVAGVGVQ